MIWRSLFGWTEAVFSQPDAENSITKTKSSGFLFSLNRLPGITHLDVKSAAMSFDSQVAKCTLNSVYPATMGPASFFVPLSAQPLSR
jgi:hypothetical protein